MKVYVKKVGCAPLVVDAEPTLEWLQAIVDGYVQLVPIGEHDGLALVCNEDGILRGLPYNADVAARAMPHLEGAFRIYVGGTEADYAQPGEMGVHRIYGDFAIVRESPDGERFIGLTDADLKALAIEGSDAAD